MEIKKLLSFTPTLFSISRILKALPVAITFFIAFFIFSPGGFAQYSNPQIDSLRTRAAKYRNKGDDHRAMEIYRTVLAAARQNRYKESVVSAYISISNIYVSQSNYKESIKNLDSALIALKSVNSYLLKARVHAELARNYFSLFHPEQALKQAKTALQYAQKIPSDSDRIRVLKYIYAVEATGFENNNNKRAFFEAIRNAYLISPEPILASRIAKYYTVYHKNLDSARHYLDIAREMCATGQYNVFQKMAVLRNEGRYQSVTGNYSEAIALYKQSLQISGALNNIEEDRLTYKLLYEAYNALKDEKGKKDALEKYAALGDSVMSKKSKSVETPLNTLTEKTNKTNWIYVTLIVSAIAATAWIFYRKLKQSRANAKTKEPLQEKDNPLLPDTANGNDNAFIPEETQQRLLTSLTAFERSQLFTSGSMSLSYLSAHLNTNSKYLSYIIKKHKQKDFNNYINELRIKYIIDKLHEDPQWRQYKISVLAEKGGFSSHSKFATIFKANTGQSPSIFIQELSNERS